MADVSDKHERKKSKHGDNKEKHRKTHHHRSHAKATGDVPHEDKSNTKDGGNREAQGRDGENWEENRQRVEALCASGPNYICAECGEAGTRWASVNHGVFVCIRCSGVHRAMGVHISKVKSTNMDKWTAAEVALMGAIGNKRAKALFESRLGATRPPSSGSTDGELRSFIERKYAQHEFAVENVASMLKKVYKQVGYGKYAKPTPAGDVGGSKETSAKAAPSRADARALREEAMRAFYGDAAVAKMAKPKTPSAALGSSSHKGEGGSGKGVAGRQEEEGDRGGHKKGRDRPSKTIHGTFGVVNVPAEVYDERRRSVLKAFLIETKQNTTASEQKKEKEEKEDTNSGPSTEMDSVQAPAAAEGALAADTKEPVEGKSEAAAKEPNEAEAMPSSEDSAAHETLDEPGAVSGDTDAGDAAVEAPTGVGTLGEDKPTESVRAAVPSMDKLFGPSSPAE